MSNLTQKERQEIIDDLTTNSAAWSGEGDIELLNRFSDDKLEELQRVEHDNRRAIQVANAAVKGVNDPNGNAIRINPETGDWEMKPTTNRRAAVGNNGDMEYEEDDEDDFDEEEAPPTRNRRRSQSPEDIFRRLPPEMQQAIQNAQAIEQREKDTIISKLLINVSEAEKHSHYERLNQRSLQDLQNDLALVPKLELNDEKPSKRPAANRLHKFNAEDDVLGLPTMQYNLEGNEDRPSVTVVNEDGGIDDDEALLAQLPERLRSKVLNASRIEQQQKEELIADITENSSFENAAEERRVLHTYRSMSLNQLKDIHKTIAPNKAYFRSKPNYSGAAGGPPVGNRSSSPSIGNEDMLLPPNMSLISNEDDEDNKRKRA